MFSVLVKWETERRPEPRTRYGCFLPDLTGLARGPSAVSLPDRTISAGQPGSRQAPSRRGDSGNVRATVRRRITVMARAAITSAMRCRRAPVCHGGGMDFAIAYSGCPLDRAAHRRGDERLASTSDCAIATSRLVPVWRSAAWSPNDLPRRSPLPAGAALRERLAEEVVFLGLGEAGRAWFACDLSRARERMSREPLRTAAPSPTSAGGDAAATAARAPSSPMPGPSSTGTAGTASAAPAAPRTEAAHGGHCAPAPIRPAARSTSQRTDPVVIMLVTRD